jgi:hypothetical protein
MPALFLFLPEPVVEEGEALRPSDELRNELFDEVGGWLACAEVLSDSRHFFVGTGGCWIGREGGHADGIIGTKLPD